MGLHRAVHALCLLLMVAGIAAQKIDDGDILSLDELTLSSTDVQPCYIPDYGYFGQYEAATVLGYGASPGQYGQYAGASNDGVTGATQFDSAAGQYGAAPAPGGYGAAAAAELLQGSQCKPLTMPGRLLSVGGLANCKGTFTPLAPQLSSLTSSTKTDPMGRFNQTGATLGIFTWPASSSCVDQVTDLPLTYNWQLVAPVYDLLIVTDLALLTMPASEGLPPLQQGTGDVYDKVYKAFGVDARKLQIDMITYENVTTASPVWPALMGINAQLSYISHAVAKTLTALKNGKAATQQQQQQQLAQLSDIVGIQDAIWSVVQTKASGDGQALLTSRELIREVLADAARRNKLPELENSSTRGQEVLFDSVARIVATSNKESLKPVVNVAMSCATSALAGMPRLTPECLVSALAASVTSVSKLQKGNMTNDILALTKAYIITGDALNTPDNIVPLEPVPAAAPVNGTEVDEDDEVVDGNAIEGVEDATKKPIEIREKPKFWAPIANWFKARRQAAKDRAKARTMRNRDRATSEKPGFLPMSDFVHKEKEYAKYGHEHPHKPAHPKASHTPKPRKPPTPKHTKSNYKPHHHEEEEEHYMHDMEDHAPHYPHHDEDYPPGHPMYRHHEQYEQYQRGPPEEQYPEHYPEQYHEQHPHGHPMYRPVAEHYKGPLEEDQQYEPQVRLEQYKGPPEERQYEPKVRLEQYEPQAAVEEDLQYKHNEQYGAHGTDEHYQPYEPAEQYKPYHDQQYGPDHPAEHNYEPHHPHEQYKHYEGPPHHEREPHTRKPEAKEEPEEYDPHKAEEQDHPSRKHGRRHHDKKDHQKGQQKGQRDNEHDGKKEHKKDHHEKREHRKEHRTKSPRDHTPSKRKHSSTHSKDSSPTHHPKATNHIKNAADPDSSKEDPKGEDNHTPEDTYRPEDTYTGPEETYPPPQRKYTPDVPEYTEGDRYQPSHQEQEPEGPYREGPEEEYAPDRTEEPEEYTERYPDKYPEEDEDPEDPYPENPEEEYSYNRGYSREDPKEEDAQYKGEKDSEETKEFYSLKEKQDHGDDNDDPTKSDADHKKSDGDHKKSDGRKKSDKDHKKSDKHKKDEEEEEWTPPKQKQRKHKKKHHPTKSRPYMRLDRRAKKEVQKLQKKCAETYDPEVCKHDLRPDCDYHNYKDGEFPPDNCHAYKSYPKSAAKAMVSIASVDSDSWGNVEPDGVSEVPATRKGVMGLLGMLGAMGAVGVVPAGGLMLNSIAPLPQGTIVITPGLVLAPYKTPLNTQQAKGVLPWSFGGNCNPQGVQLPLEQISGNTPADILKLIPQGTCLPTGWLYKMPNLADAGFSANLSKLPSSTVVLSDDTLYLPKKDNTIIKSLVKAIPAIEQAEWTTPKRAEEVKEDAGIKVIEADGKQYVVISDVKGHARLANMTALRESEEPKKTGLIHGNAECIKQGAPPASCAQGATLPAAGLLSAKPAKALAPANLEGAAVAVGYVQGCGGDYFSYNELAGAVEDVKQLSIDRRFSGVFKAFTTGEDAKAAQTWGSFGVGNVTGRGHAILTNTWACADKIPEDAAVCIDSWTGAQIKVPIGGLVPYPKDYKRNKMANVDVTISPLALTTLASVNSSTDVAAAYADAYKAAEVKLSANALTADPVRLVKTGKTPQVRQGVSLMVENARTLNMLTTARALYECRSAPSPELSNELFVQWAEKLLKPNIMTRPGPLKAAFRDLCLDGACSDNAAGALLMINKYLGVIKAKYTSLKDKDAVPLSLVDDLVKLVQLAHVGQVELYDSIRSCCGLIGATSAGPLDDFVHRMEDLTRMASIKTAEIQQAAAMALGGGVDTSSSSSTAAGSSSSSGELTDHLESSTSSMVGTLLNNGGIRDCKGILYPLVEGESPLSLFTDAQGQFIVDEPLDGIYKFSSALAGSSCVDSLTGVPITFPMIQQVPATLSATITAISLLSGPAKSDPAIRELVTVNGQVSPELLVNYVYRLYGLDAEDLDVDFFTFTGNALQMGSPRLAQVSGAIAQTMATYMTGHSMLTALFNGKVSSDQIAQCIVEATYKKFAKAGNAIATLTEQEGVSAIFKAAFKRCAPPSRRRALLSADADTPGAAYAGIANAFKNARPDLKTQNTTSEDVWETLASMLAKSGSTVTRETISSNPVAAASADQPASNAAVNTAAAAQKPASQPAVGIAAVPAQGDNDDAADTDEPTPTPAPKTAAKAAKQAAPAADVDADAKADEPTPAPKAAPKAGAKGAKKTAAAPKAAAPKPVGAMEVDDLFAAAARVVAVSNQKIQQSVVMADRAVSSNKKTGFNVNAVMANISGVAAVQQSDFVHTVGQLATTVAGDMADGEETPDLQRGLFQTQIAELEESFTGDALQDRIEAKTAVITPQSVARNMANVGKNLAVDDEGRIGLLAAQAPKPKAKVHPGIIAGAVVGGVLLLAAIAALTFFMVRRGRKAVASSPFVLSAGSEAAPSIETSVPFAPSDTGAPAAAAAVASPRKLRLIGRRSNATDKSEGSTPRSTAGPVAEAVLDRQSGSSGYGSGGNVLLMNNNPLFMPQSPVRSPAGNLRDME